MYMLNHNTISSLDYYSLCAPPDDGVLIYPVLHMNRTPLYHVKDKVSKITLVGMSSQDMVISLDLCWLVGCGHGGGGRSNHILNCTATKYYDYIDQIHSSGN